MKNIILTLSICGLLFSGYMSGVKFFAKTCAFGETCPLFLGLPACYFGFIMFLTITIFSVLLYKMKAKENSFISGITAISFLGILFSGYFTLGELPLLFSEGLRAYALGLPTCALGMIFYIALFVTSLFARKK